MPALQMAAIRQFLAGSVFVIFFLFKKEPWPQKKEWVSIFVLSILNLVLTNGLTTLGVKYIPAGLGAIIAAIFPLWLAIISFFIEKTFISTRTFIGLLLGFGGVCIIFYEHLKDFFIADFRFGIFISVLGSISWAFGTFYTKRQARSFNPYFSIGLQMVIAGIILFIFSSATDMIIPIKNIPWQAWADIIYLFAVGSILTFISFLYALKNLPTAQVSIYAYINPVVAVLLGAILFEEKMTVFVGIGGAITLYGVYFVNEATKNENARK